MARKRNGIRSCDLVRIETPEFFVRCGYPKDFQSEAALVKEKFGPDIKAFLAKCGLFESKLDVDVCLTPNNTFSRAYEKTVSAVAYARLKQNGFGGYKRQIYTKSIPLYEGQEVYVSSVKFVKTGEYESAYNSYSWDCGCYEYEPAYLANVQTHRILILCLEEPETNDRLMIEASKVKLVEQAPERPSQKYSL